MACRRFRRRPCAVLHQEGADGYEVHEIRYSACQACGSAVFGVEGSFEDPEDAVIADAFRRTCRPCGHQQYLADSGEYWSEDHTFVSVCACGEEDFHIAVGFSLYADNMGIRSLAIATMCLACGKLGILAEWMVRHNDMTLLDRS